MKVTKTKIFALALVLILTLAVTACGNSKTNVDEQPGTSESAAGTQSSSAAAETEVSTAPPTTQTTAVTFTTSTTAAASTTTAASLTTAQTVTTTAGATLTTRPPVTTSPSTTKSPTTQLSVAKTYSKSVTGTNGNVAMVIQEVVKEEKIRIFFGNENTYEFYKTVTAYYIPAQGTTINFAFRNDDLKKSIMESMKTSDGCDYFIELFEPMTKYSAEYEKDSFVVYGQADSNYDKLPDGSIGKKLDDNFDRKKSMRDDMFTVKCEDCTVYIIYSK